MRKKPIFILLAACVVLLPGVAMAELVICDAASQALATVNPDTGTLTAYATAGTPHVVSLAYDHATGRAYCSDTSEGVNQILEIDPYTGSTTLIVQVEDFWTTIHSLAVHPTTGELYAIDNAHADLYRVDIDAGALDLVGNFGVYWISGLDFDPVSGDLYGCVGGLDSVGALYTIDVQTATATHVADTERLMGLAFTPEGTLYGVDNHWYPDEPGIYRIDKTTGAAETIGLYPDMNLLSIEWMDLGIVAVEPMSLSDVKGLFE
jgi:DNA-binding beta-propeller fold protein YncE